MARSNWKFIKCPFFHSDTMGRGGNQSSIICEGALVDSSCRMIFQKGEDLVKWEHKYCYSVSECECCHIYLGAMMKYGTNEF